MPGRGRAPKAPDKRRNASAPQRGEWVQLTPLDGSVLPDLPRRSKGEGPWSSRSKRAWEAWRLDPATGMYGPAEIQAAIDMAYVYEDWVREGRVNHASEIRQRLDVLGLSPKGKQDRRWAPPSGEQAAAPARKPADVLHLRAV